MRAHLIVVALVSLTPACDPGGSASTAGAADTNASQDIGSSDVPTTADTPAQPIAYSLDSETFLTATVGHADTDTADSGCQGKFVAVGVTAFESYPINEFKLITVNLRCVQLKSNGLGALVSDGPVVGRLPVGGADGSNKTSSCAAGELMVGLSYGINGDGAIGGVAAMCVPLDVWADEAQAPEPSDGKVIGDADTGSISCPQGSALVALRASGWGSIQNLQAVCAEIFTSE